MITVAFQTYTAAERQVRHIEGATDEFRYYLLAWDPSLPVNLVTYGGKMGFQVPIRVGSRPLIEVVEQARAHFPDGIGGVPVYLEVSS